MDTKKARPVSIPPHYRYTPAVAHSHCVSTAGAPVTSNTTVRYSLLKSEFLGQLLSDLRKAGFRTRLRRSGSRLQVSIYDTRTFDEGAPGITECEAALRPEDRNFLTSAVARGIRRSFTCGKRVDPSRIRPTLEYCATDTQFALFRFCRLLQSVAAPRLLYRQLAIIVRDAGQEARPIIGIAGLTSPVYSMRCRDGLFGWTAAPADVRNAGLQKCMQLGVCMAVPPYDQIRGAKLVAMLAASQEVANEYRLRYGWPLLAIVTTAARGLHTPIFNRIMLKPGGLYRRIGETSGYSALPFSRATLAAAKRLVVARDGACPATTDRPIRALKRAMNLCGIPRERLMRLGIRKGVYAAWPDAHALRGLASTRSNFIPEWPTASEAFAYWKRRELERILKSRPHVRRFLSSGWNNILQTLGDLK